MTDHDTKIVVFTGFLSVVPARAGVIPALSVTRPAPSGGPRASGGDPSGQILPEKMEVWSPRERG